MHVAPMSDYEDMSLGKLLAASQSSVKSRNALRFARVCRLIERDMVKRGREMVVDPR
jgi:hypothetical protein